jgi:hypothetical protein
MYQTTEKQARKHLPMVAELVARVKSVVQSASPTDPKAIVDALGLVAALIKNLSGEEEPVGTARRREFFKNYHYQFCQFLISEVCPNWVPAFSQVRFRLHTAGPTKRLILPLRSGSTRPWSASMCFSCHRTPLVWKVSLPWVTPFPRAGPIRTGKMYPESMLLLKSLAYWCPCLLMTMASRSCCSRRFVTSVALTGQRWMLAIRTSTLQWVLYPLG